MALAVLSVLATAVAGYVFVMKQDVFDIAGTQWILIGIVLGVYATYAMHCPCDCGGGSCCAKPEEK